MQLSFSKSNVGYNVWHFFGIPNAITRSRDIVPLFPSPREMNARPHGAIEQEHQYTKSKALKSTQEECLQHANMRSYSTLYLGKLPFYGRTLTVSKDPEAQDVFETPDLTDDTSTIPVSSAIKFSFFSRSNCLRLLHRNRRRTKSTAMPFTLNKHAPSSSPRQKVTLCLEVELPASEEATVRAVDGGRRTD